ncbi:MAG: carboxylating nicotinate-nucleotide diphosphorylase [Bacilli bacterium]|nr:carboxylating nicotinate-nucleotide diphosphorylase [Bacilli bacterium]MBN2876090.1 carboxylating nicotinate-nucleotide diphosphorylase [Bacilli bacterium]
MNNEIIDIIQRALNEDIPTIDISSHYLFHDEISTGVFIAKEEGILSGVDVCQETFRQVDSDTEFIAFKNNGDKVTKGEVFAEVKGKTKSILMSERIGLNFMQRMSGIATMTARFVKETEGTKAKIQDTRKTTPTLRILEKQAVRDGGGINHRMSLSEMVMLKDNHIAAAGSLTKAVNIVRKNLVKNIMIEVEVESVEAFKEALQTSANIIMLDNMDNESMRECVKLNKGKKILEASGNMTLERIHDVAKTGVDTISCGSLTHSYKSLDISLKF